MATEKMKNSTRMCGYLEKRGKWTITGTWKRWWCVLEGQLLLYYKSRTQYLRLAPCSGSLNIVFVKSVLPHTQRQIHVITYSQIMIFRALSKEEQQNWFLAFINALPRHYKGHLGDKMPLILQQTDHTKAHERCDYCENSSVENDEKAHREGDSNTDFRLREKSQFQKGEEKSLTDGSECNRISSEYINRHKKPETINGKQSSSYHNVGTAANGTRAEMKIIRMKRFHSFQCITNFTDENFITPSTEKCFSYRSTLVLAKSHECVHCNPSPGYFTEKYAFQFEKHTESCLKKTPACRKIERKESFCFLKKKVFSNQLGQKDLNNSECEQKTVTEKEDEQMMTTRTRQEDDLTEVEEETQSTLTRKTRILHKDRENQEFSHSEERSSRSEIKPSIRNSERFSHCFPPNIIDNTQFDELPKLPIKKKVNSAKYSSKIAEMNVGAYGSIGRGCKTTFKHSSTNLDSLLFQLTLLTRENSKDESSAQRTNADSEEDPDYDFPIPHASLIDRSLSERILPNKTDTTAKNDLSHNFGSEKLSSFSLTPDSLEAPWMLVDSKQMNRWSTLDYTLDSLNRQSESNNDTSLNSLHPSLRL